MKFRNGFVTNSSSSSFILAYNQENIVIELWNQLQASYGEIQAGEYLGYIMEYLNQADNQADCLNEFLSRFSEDIKWEENFNYREELEEKGMHYTEVRDKADSEEGKKEIQERIKRRTNKLEKSITGFNTVKKINISDDYEPLSSLEYKVVRNLKECKDVRSCH